jgi:hypothetical protein
MLLLEDLNGYVGDYIPQDLIGKIVRARHADLDIITHFQSIGRISPKIWQNLNFLRVHKITDDVIKHHSKYEEKLELLLLVEAYVNTEYENGNKRIFVYVDIDDEKIKGNFTDKLFDIAVDEYIAKNYSDTVAPLLRARDFSGKKNHTNQSAVTAVKDKLQLYRI